MKIVSWFNRMRYADCPKWNNMIAIAALIPNTLILGIHPAAVNCPLWASLVGISSHVKLSVRSIARSILLWWCLRQRKQAKISRPVNEKKKILLLCIYSQWILWPRDSEIQPEFFPFCVENRNQSSKYPTLSVNPTLCKCYRGPVSEYYTGAEGHLIVMYCACTLLHGGSCPGFEQKLSPSCVGIKDSLKMDAGRDEFWRRMRCVFETSGVNNLLAETYVYWNVHNFDSWIKIDQPDVNCFIISLFIAQHVSNVSTYIFRSLRFIVHFSASACIRIPHHPRRTTP